MMDFSYTIYIALFPFLVFVINGLFGSKIKESFAGYLGVAGMVIATYLSYITAYNYFFKVGKDLDGAYQKIVGFNLEWLRFTDSLHINIGVLLGWMIIFLFQNKV